jgi:hypothetical protein
MSPEFDQLIADWLENDPDSAPETVLVAVLAAFPSIPQRRTSRVPWRPRPMTMTRSAVATIAVIVAVGGFMFVAERATQVGAPSTSASPSATATTAPLPSGFARFTSVKYPYSIGYPATWSVRPALPNSPEVGIDLKGYGSVGAGADWVGAGVNGVGHGGVVIWATKHGTAPSLDLPAGTACPMEAVGCRERILIGGEPGLIVWNENQGIAQAWVLHAGRMFLFSSMTGSDQAARDSFLTILSTVLFTE